MSDLYSYVSGNSTSTVKGNTVASTYGNTVFFYGAGCEAVTLTDNVAVTIGATDANFSLTAMAINMSYAPVTVNFSKDSHFNICNADVKSSAQGNYSVAAGGELQLSSTIKMMLETTGDLTLLSNEGSINIGTVRSNISIDSAKELELKAPEIINIQLSKNQFIKLSDAGVELTVGSNQIKISEQGITLSSNGNTITLGADGAKVISDSQVQLDAPAVKCMTEQYSNPAGSSTAAVAQQQAEISASIPGMLEPVVKGRNYEEPMELESSVLGGLFGE